jgi:hypothetical protein
MATCWRLIGFPDRYSDGTKQWEFKGPADLCAFPNSKGLMVVVPDLVKGELRFVQLGK